MMDIIVSYLYTYLYCQGAHEHIEITRLDTLPYP